MTFIIAGLFWILGVFIGSMGLIQMMMILFFSIPFTRQLHRLGLITNTGIIYKMNMTALAIWTLIIGGVSTLAYLYASHLSFKLYLIGIGVTFLMGMGKTGTNDNNVQDYFIVHHRLINLGGLINVDAKFGTMILNYLDKAYKESGIGI